MYLSIIIPCYNEAQRLPKTLRRVLDYLRRKDYAWEIIVVDDGSSDETYRVASGAHSATRVVRHEHNRGKGAAVRTGAFAGTGEYILVMDADLSTPIEELDRLLPHADNGADIVIGSRAIDRSRVERRQNFFRESVGRIGNILIRNLLGLPWKDTQCGFKLFRRDAAHSVLRPLQMHRWSFDYEILTRAHALGYTVAEIPVTWRNDPASRFHLVRDALRSTLDLLHIARLQSRLRTAPECIRIPFPIMKRLFDVAFSGILFALASPLFLFIILCMALEMFFDPRAQGPLFYKETRMSEGYPFTLYKFRTIRQAVLDDTLRREGFIHTKALEHREESLTWCGRLLRNLYLDELPQLWNVFRGDMSMVGPRPVNTEVYARLRQGGVCEKSVIRAGLTGAYQAHKGEPGAHQLMLDEEYIEFCRRHTGFRIVLHDITILVRTLLILARAQGI